MEYEGGDIMVKNLNKVKLISKTKLDELEKDINDFLKEHINIVNVTVTSRAEFGRTVLIATILYIDDEN